jgi:hypothetical protein
MEKNPRQDEFVAREHGERQHGQVPDDSYDKTIEDSFPASDPPSSIPAPEPCEDENTDKAA